MATVGSASALRFGNFAFHPSAGELSKAGTRPSVPDQWLAILASRPDRPSEVVAREEIRERLWLRGAIVEFEHSVNSALKRRGGALSESAATPRCVETPSPAVSPYRTGIVFRAGRMASALNQPNTVTPHDGQAKVPPLLRTAEGGLDPQTPCAMPVKLQANAMSVPESVKEGQPALKYATGGVQRAGARICRSVPDQWKPAAGVAAGDKVPLVLGVAGQTSPPVPAAMR